MLVVVVAVLTMEVLGGQGALAAEEMVARLQYQPLAQPTPAVEEVVQQMMFLAVKELLGERAVRA